MIEARFDDLSSRPRSFRFVEPAGVIEARRPGEVRGALAAAESAAARGLWAAGFVAYEAAPGFDPSFLVRTRAESDPFSDLPLVWFALFDRREETTLPDPPTGGSAETPPLEAVWQPSIPRERYDRSVTRIREHIAAGDTYQVNYTLRLRAGVRGDERGLYRDLCLAQRGAYGAYLNLGRYRVLSASPELFLRIDADRIVTRPMKGTVGRGRWADEDLDLATQLRASEKDRAENAMIVDLLRNDLGRIARTGTVRVPEMFTTERYETVWQMTSTVTAELETGRSVVDVFGALFPSGSVTGAPKVRTMQLIAELEDSPRGVYCGAVGYLAPPGSAEPRASFNVAIRTVVLDTQHGVAEFGVGGGITHDSRAQSEYDEVLAKARVLAERRPPFRLLETMRLDPDGTIASLDRHLDRLAGSAGYFGFEFVESDLRSSIASAIAGRTGPARVRLTLGRGGDPTVEVHPMPPDVEEPVRVEIDTHRIDPSDPLLFHKSTRREIYEAAAARHPGADDVLLVNERDEITESTIANVAVLIDDVWWTPPLTSGCLPGTRRAACLKDGSIREGVITVEDVRGADRLALLNATRGWRPARLQDDVASVR